MSFAEKVKEVLLERIHEMSGSAWLFVQNPESDFGERESSFRSFNNAFEASKMYRGYRLLACDGNSLNIARNPDDQENYYQTSPDAE